MTVVHLGQSVLGVIWLKFEQIDTFNLFICANKSLFLNLWVSSRKDCDIGNVYKNMLYFNARYLLIPFNISIINFL